MPAASYGICLRTLLALHNVELYFVAFFERFVSVQLNCRIVDENIRPVFASDESVALGVVKPLDLTFVLSHRPCLPWFLVLVLGDPGESKEGIPRLSLIHISEPTRQAEISYAVFCL